MGKLGSRKRISEVGHNIFRAGNPLDDQSCKILPRGHIVVLVDIDYSRPMLDKLLLLNGWFARR